MWLLREGYSCTPILGSKLLSCLVVFRVLNALVVRTSFTPDEFWQGPEPAHLLAFGKGHLTWEWEPSARIRGFTHPLVFAAVYKALQIAGVDTRWAVAHSPKLLQGMTAGLCDYYTFGLALQSFGPAAAGWALLFQVLSWFNFYCLVRPYSNSAETVLATAALFYWIPFLLPSSSGAVRVRGASGGPKKRREGVIRGGDDIGGSISSRGETSTAAVLEKKGGGTLPVPLFTSTDRKETVALLLAALCVAVRPTSAALWAVVGLLRLSKLPPRRWLRYLSLTVLPPVVCVVGASFYLDSRMYGAPTLVPLNFLRFNVLEGKSRIFGEQAWHWNFSQGLPAVLGAALPAALWGFWRPASGSPVAGRGRCAGGGSRLLGWLAVWFLVYHSTSPHKEFRFLLPVLPIAHAYAGQAVSYLMATMGIGTGGAKTDQPARRNNADGPVSGEAKEGAKAESGKSNDDVLAIAAAGKPPFSYERRRRRWQTSISTTLFILHVPAAVYLSVWHQSGALSAVDAVARRVPVIALAKKVNQESGQRPRGEQSPASAVTVHFLMPCHSAPLHSHLHFGALETAFWSLDCSPKNRELPGGSESDKFQADPLAFLTSVYGTVAGRAQGGAPPPPDLAVMYSTHLARLGVADYLSGLGLKTVETLFNAHVNGDADCDDTHRSVAVLERTLYCQSGDVGADNGSCTIERSDL